MAKITEKELRYNAVYGAFVALQVRDRMKEGHGPPDCNLMRNFVEEAYAVADLAQEAQQWELTEEDEDES